VGAERPCPGPEIGGIDMVLRPAARHVAAVLRRDHAWMLAAGSLAVWAAVFTHGHRTMWQMVDLDIYVKAVRGLPHSENLLYARRYGRLPGPFLYPPFAAILLRGAVVCSEPSLRMAMAAASVAALAVLSYCCWHLLGRRGLPAARAAALTFALGLWLEPVVRTVFFGQVSLLLWAAVLADFALPRGRWRGVLTGLAAGFKLTPVLFLGYFLLTGRRREAATCAATASATALLGALLLPRASADFWLRHLLRALGADRLGADRINGQVTIGDASDQSLRALLFRALPHSGWLQPCWLALAAVFLGLGLAAAFGAYRRGDEATGLCLTAATGLLVAPVSWTHYWIPVLLAVCRLAHGRVSAASARARRICSALALGCALLFLAWPIRLGHHGRWNVHEPVLPWGVVWLAPHAGGQEFTWSAAEFVIGNAYLLAALAFVLWFAARAVLTPRGPDSPTAAPGIAQQLPAPAGSPHPSAAEAALLEMYSE
jgi:alpha-1,2-mannosyltransferase